MPAITEYARQYAAYRENASELYVALSAMNFVLAGSSFVMAVLFWSPPDFFLRPATPPNEIWLSLVLGGVELWDVMFPLAALALVLSTLFHRKLATAHAIAAASWGLMGITWAFHGMVNAPTEFFGVGVLGIFMAAIHVVSIRLWSVERVE